MLGDRWSIDAGPIFTQHFLCWATIVYLFALFKVFVLELDVNECPLIADKSRQVRTQTSWIINPLSPDRKKSTSIMCRPI